MRVCVCVCVCEKEIERENRQADRLITDTSKLMEAIRDSPRQV